jgi:hypothetical protein
MIHITHDMLPTLRTSAGLVTVARPLPPDAAMTPMIAVAYACSLIDAAAQAEGYRLVGGTARWQSVIA